MKTSKVRIIANILLVLAVMLGLGAFSSQASAAPQKNSDVKSAAEDGVKASATRPWTAAEMAAAIPYPDTLTTEAAPALDAVAAPNGPAGFAAGAMPGGKPFDAALAGPDLGVPVPTSGGYTYPYPFTRQYVSSFSAEVNYPFETVGKLFFTQRDSGGTAYNYVCSASAIANRGILSAGHCAHNGTGHSNGWSYNIVFVPAYRAGASPKGQWTVVGGNNIWVMSNWYYYANARQDFSVMKMNTLGGYTLGQRVGYLGYAWNQSYYSHWWAIGYPQASPFNGAYMTACQASYATYYTFGSSGPSLFAFGCDQTGGTSGGPVILAFGTSNYVNGVNAYKYSNRPLELISPYVDSVISTNLMNLTRTW
jgi:V8-like Glu-specific endopeptidase